MSTVELVPATFDEMYRHYREYVIKLIVSSGIPPQDAQDVAQAILTRFYEKNALNNYDANFTSSHEGKLRKASFLTFLSGFVKLYIRHYRDRSIIERRRELTFIDQPNVAPGIEVESVSWMDSEGYVHEDVHETMEDVALAREISAHLALVKRSSNRDKCDMAVFFHAVLEQAYNGGVDTAALAVKFDVTRATIQNWMVRLRAEVQVVITA